MNKLKFKLEQFDNVLVFQILEQDESITHIENSHNVLKYTASNGIAISSLYYPEWAETDSEKILYIRGVVKDAPNAVVITLSNAPEAELLKFSILEALQEWSRNGYFEGYFDLIDKDDNGVYTV